MEIHIERTIERPADEVFKFLADVGNNLTWQSGMKSCEWTTDPPIAVGSRYKQVAEFRNKPVVSTFEVTSYEPGHAIRYESIESTFPIQVTRTVEPAGDGSCRVTADVSGQPGGVMRLLTFLGERVARKSIEADYDRLVEHFHSQRPDPNRD